MIVDSLDYAIRKHIELYTPEIEETQPVYDGASITDIPKPFVTVEYMPSNFTRVSTSRSYEEVYYFQLGLFASNPHEVLRLSDKIRDVLHNPNGMTYYSYNGGTATFEETVLERKPTVEVEAFTPIRNEDPSQATYDHHGYFDVAITLYRKPGEDVFTQ